MTAPLAFRGGAKADMFHPFGVLHDDCSPKLVLGGTVRLQ
jgi:hypothetical protein